MRAVAKVCRPKWQRIGATKKPWNMASKPKHAGVIVRKKTGNLQNKFMYTNIQITTCMYIYMYYYIYIHTYKISIYHVYYVFYVFMHELLSLYLVRRILDKDCSMGNETAGYRGAPNLPAMLGTAHVICWPNKLRMSF